MQGIVAPRHSYPYKAESRFSTGFLLIPFYIPSYLAETRDFRPYAARRSSRFKLRSKGWRPNRPFPRFPQRRVHTTRCILRTESVFT